MRENKTTSQVLEDYLITRQYDLRRIDSEHPLCPHISKTVKIGKDDKNAVDTYLRFAGVVLDPDSKNFHIFPRDREVCGKLAEDFETVKKVLKEKLVEKMEDGWTISAGNGRHKRQATIEEMRLLPEERFEGLQLQLYKHITIKKPDKTEYTINFMRYTFDGKKVGCTMKEIQFHKCTGNINIGKDENGKAVFAICYTEDDEDGRCCEVSGNVCYNPPVRFPKPENDEDTINNIVTKFMDFMNGKYE